MKFLTKKWNFFIAGAFFALFFNLSLYILDGPIGMSHPYLMISEFCKNTIYSQRIADTSFLNWEIGFLVGILIGAFLASLIGKEFKLVMKPEGTSSGRFGSTLSPISGAGGGFLVMLGLQLAGDSFFGHWASAMQLSTASWLFIIISFSTAILISVTHTTLFKKNSGGNE